MDNTRSVYGIDLGTTYSCIAQVDKFDQAIVLRNFEGDATTPSAVYFEDMDHVVVGKEAKGISVTEPTKTAVFIKRHIGVDDSFDKNTNEFPYHYDPTEISAFILKSWLKMPTIWEIIRTDQRCRYHLSGLFWNQRAYANQAGRRNSRLKCTFYHQ